MEDKKIRGSNFDRYGFTFGFHTNGTNKTDFYSEFELGKLYSPPGNSNTYGLNIGTRTAFSSNFELITKLGYTHIERVSDGLYQAEVKGLFKLSDNHGLTAAIESLHGDPGASLGYRFSF